MISAPASIRRQQAKGPALLASGHRLLFLSAGLYGAAPMLAWIATLSGLAAFTPSWHGHEMVFGFATAGIGGFLTAAVPKWTRTGLFKGRVAALLFGLWLLGRVAMWTGLLPWLDALFLPVITAMVATRIFKARNTRNYQVVGMLALLAGFNMAWHAGWEPLALRGATYVIVALVALVGGRVVPLFTANQLRRTGGDPDAIKRVGILDRGAVSMVLVAGALMLWQPAAQVTGVAWLAVGGAMAARSLRWGLWPGRQWPIVLVMHVAWWFVPVGLLLGGLASLGVAVPASAALHALTSGAIGGMLIAIASRAARGHSGRPLITSRWTRLAYALVIGSAILRVVAGAHMHVLTGAMWSAGWLLFAIEHAPMLVMTRLDGQPG